MARERILLYATQMLETGGIESHITEFLTQMTIYGNSDIDIVILNAYLSENQTKHIKSLTGISILSKKKIRKNTLEWLKTGWSVLKSIFTKYDALYTNGQGNSIYWITKIFRYDKWIHHHHTSGDPADQKTWSATYMKALKTADVVVACSAKNASAMQPVLKRHIVTVPCFSRAVCIRKKGQKGISRNRIHLGYYGRLIPEKGIDLIGMLSNDPTTTHIQFHIWGRGEKYPLEYFSKYPNLIYHGTFKGEEELTNVLSLLDGYLLLSTHPEGLPISLLEVMSAGLPWLATNQGGISDIACDPLTTRLLNSTADFDTVKNEVLSFASAITTGKINHQQQQAMYNSRFSSPVLVKQWKSILYADNTIML